MAGIFWIGVFPGLTEEMLGYVTATIREFCRSRGKFALFAFLGTFLFFWMFFTTRNFSQSRQLDNIMDLFVISFLSYLFLIALDRVNVKSIAFDFCVDLSFSMKWIG